MSRATTELQVVLPDETTSMPAQRLVNLARAAEELDYAAAWLHLRRRIRTAGDHRASGGGHRTHLGHYDCALSCMAALAHAVAKH